jgi:hypothetical protein
MRSSGSRLKSLGCLLAILSVFVLAPYAFAQAPQLQKVEMVFATAKTGETTQWAPWLEKTPIYGVTAVTATPPAGVSASMTCLFDGRSAPQVVMLPGTCNGSGRFLSLFQFDFSPETAPVMRAQVDCKVVNSINYGVDAGALCGERGKKLERLSVYVRELPRPAEFSIANGIARYRLISPAQCWALVPLTSNSSVPRGESAWSGRCVDGLADGAGEMRVTQGGATVERTLTRYRAGLEDGPRTSLNTDPASRERGFQTFMTMSAGYPTGQVTLLGPGGIVYAEGVADGRGGIRQTSDPGSPLIQLLGRAGRGSRTLDGLNALLSIFAPGLAQTNRASVETCQTGLVGAGYTKAAATEWCALTPRPAG